MLHYLKTVGQKFMKEWPQGLTAVVLEVYQTWRKYSCGLPNPLLRDCSNKHIRVNDKKTSLNTICKNEPVSSLLFSGVSVLTAQSSRLIKETVCQRIWGSKLQNTLLSLFTKLAVIDVFFLCCPLFTCHAFNFPYWLPFYDSCVLFLKCTDNFDCFLNIALRKGCINISILSLLIKINSLIVIFSGS